jgi:hypothetical protein
MKQPAVYILASRMNGALYIGVTQTLPEGSGNTRMTWLKALRNATAFIASSGMNYMRLWRLLSYRKRD